MPSENGSADGWAFSEFRDWLERRHRRETFLPVHATEVDDADARRTLTAMRAAYDRAARQGRLPKHAPGRIEETDTYQDLRMALGTETAAHATQEGESHVLRSMVGSADDEPDISGMRTFETLKEIITEPASMFYIWGSPGAGKTMLGSLIAELWKKWVGGKVASNIRTMDPAEWIPSWPQLEEWMKEPEEIVLAGDQTPKLYLLDEGSSVASGRGKSGYEASIKLAVLCYKIRKYGGHLIIIGHDGKDVAPAVRELCVAVHKTGKKSVQFFNDVKDREGKDPITDPLKGVPLPDKPWQPNTYDTATFRWDGQEDAEDLEATEIARDLSIYTVIRCKERDGLSDRETSKFVPFSRQWVNDRWSEYDEEGMHAGVVDRVEALTA